VTLPCYHLGTLHNCYWNSAELSRANGVGSHGAGSPPALQPVRIAMPERHGDQIVETTTEARAAQTGTGLRWVLIFGTLGVVIIFALLWFHYFT
jgi:hypothetical protein